MAHPKIKVKDRKLGREKAFGLAYIDTGKIHIDPRQSSKTRLNTLLHESLHVIFPDMSESRIKTVTGRLTQVLLKDNWRRIAK